MSAPACAVCGKPVGFKGGSTSVYRLTCSVRCNNILQGRRFRARRSMAPGPSAEEAEAIAEIQQARGRSMAAMLRLREMLTPAAASGVQTPEPVSPWDGYCTPTEWAP